MLVDPRVSQNHDHDRIKRDFCAPFTKPERFCGGNARTVLNCPSVTVDKLRSLFAQLGCPEELVSDNGPQFVASLFAQLGCRISGVPETKWHTA